MIRLDSLKEKSSFITLHLCAFHLWAYQPFRSRPVLSYVWKEKIGTQCWHFYPVHRMSTFTLSLLGSRCRPKRFRIENGYFELDEQVLLCVDVIEILPCKYALRRKSSLFPSVGHVWLQCLWFVYFMSISFFRVLSNLTTFKGDARMLKILDVSCQHDPLLGSHSSQILKSFSRATKLSQLRSSDVQ